VYLRPVNGGKKKGVESKTEEDTNYHLSHYVRLQRRELCASFDLEKMGGEGKGTSSLNGGSFKLGAKGGSSASMATREGGGWSWEDLTSHLRYAD